MILICKIEVKLKGLHSSGKTLGTSRSLITRSLNYMYIELQPHILGLEVRKKQTCHESIYMK
jgi:hypothetical protein